MTERNDTGGSTLARSPLHTRFETVREFSEGIAPTLDFKPLGFRIPLMWRFWRAYNRTGTGVHEPAESNELFHWREVGWIFRQGQCIAIEEKGPEVRARIMAV
jgi:hypothetical protein